MEFTGACDIKPFYAWLVLYPKFREGPGLSPSPENDYPDLCLLWFSSVSTMKCYAVSWPLLCTAERCVWNC
jgi:hypothetical protein